MIKVLSLIFLVLMLLLDAKKGVKTYICFYINYILIIGYIYAMHIGVDAILCSFIMCLLVSIVSLCLTNGINIKSISSFISICAALLFMFMVIFVIGENANIHGFATSSLDSISMFSLDINCNMKHLIIGITLACTIGTMIDTSISISSALNEVYFNNNTLKFSELYNSGINIGRDILGTTINTLFFAFLGGLISFLFWHYQEGIELIINNKAFLQEIIELLCCCIGSILIIPITSYVMSKILLNDKSTKKIKY